MKIRFFCLLTCKVYILYNVFMGLVQILIHSAWINVLYYCIMVMSRLIIIIETSICFKESYISHLKSPSCEAEANKNVRCCSLTVGATNQLYGVTISLQLRSLCFSLESHIHIKRLYIPRIQDIYWSIPFLSVILLADYSPPMAIVL
jgi:hypothetical protein